MQFNAKIIELFGLPRTGKTTTAKFIQQHLEMKGFKVHIVKERASVSPIKDKLHPIFNYWTMSAFILEYIEANEAGYDFVIADRGVFDSLIWVKLLSSLIKEKRYEEEFLKLIDQPFILENIIASFYFEASEEVIFKREFQRKKQKNFGRIMNPKMIRSYQETYKALQIKLSALNPIIEINTSCLTIKELANLACDEIDAIVSPPVTGQRVYGHKYIGRGMVKQGAFPGLPVQKPLTLKERSHLVSQKEKSPKYRN